MKQRYLVPIMLLALTLPALPVRADEFSVRIVRLLEKGAQCTVGELWVKGQRIGYSLELPWRWNEKDVSAIPPGSYAGDLRYDKSDHWRIQLREVQGRTGVQIHIGNVPRETLGCILVGTTWDERSCQLGGSAAAYREMKKAFYGSEEPVASPLTPIRVQIELAPGVRSEP